MEFVGFLGNEDLKARLSASFRNKRTSHCYLLCGPSGSGKRTLAKLLAAALQCTEPTVPCGHCAPCRKVCNGTHPDVITVDDPEKKTVQVDLIRKARADMYVRPNEGNHKIYVIPRAQDMNDNAQNALLKILEEPPSYGVFLLLTDNAEKLLPTVRSRCVELRLGPVPEPQAMPWLAERFPHKAQADLQAAYRRSGGYLGQTAALLEKELTLPQTEEFAAAFAKADAYRLTCLLCAMEKLSRDKLLELLEQWHSLLADALLARSGVAVGRQASELGNMRTVRALMDAAGIVRQAMEHCRANVGTGHICGWLAVKLRS